MNSDNLELLRHFLRFSIRQLRQLWISFLVFRAFISYSKLKTALTAAVERVSSLVRGAGSSCASPTCVSRPAFQDSTIDICPTAQPRSNSGRFRTFSQGCNLRRFCHSLLKLRRNLECIKTMATHQFQLGSPRRPVMGILDNICQSSGLTKDRKLEKSDIRGRFLLNEGETEKLNEIGSGFIDGNGMKVSSCKRALLPMKRRRPPRLEIPQPTSPMSAASCFHMANTNVETPKEIYYEGCNYSVACQKGCREVKEDAFTAMTDISGDSTQAFFGVFDGHGGHEAANFAAENLGQNIVDAMMELKQGDDCVEQAARTGYLTTDEAFLKQNISSGTCCVTAMMKQGQMVVAHVGDCRAVLSVDGNAVALTSDHRMEREDERRRIENLGGYVDYRNGVWRVQGMLAVSRSIGDLHLKEWISAEPEIKSLNITSNCEFLILASDGLWDKVSNQEAVDIVRHFSVQNSTSSGLSGHSMGACRKLVEVAVRRGSKDDVTVMIVDLRNFCT